MLRSCGAVLIRKPNIFLVCQDRCKANIITMKPAEPLWDSASPTKQRIGRGKRAKKKQRVDLGKEKVLGEGEIGMVWPGLNINIKDTQ